MQRMVMVFVCGFLTAGLDHEALAQAPRPLTASGLEIGDSVESWRPVHIAGPNRGTNACPVCTYLERPAVLVFTKDSANAEELARRVEELVSLHRHKDLKGFVVVLDSTPEKLAQLAAKARISKAAICYPDPVSRDEDLHAYKINPAATNTVLIYKDYTVTARFVDLPAKDFRLVEAAVAKTVR